MLISAVARLRLGDRPGALRDLSRARALCRHVGDLEPLLLLPTDERDALLDEAGYQLLDVSRRRLAEVGPRWPEHAELIELTSREAVVLEAMTQHETAPAVARTLSVSVNRVKKQMVAVYEKLGVHDRGAALLRARRPGSSPTSTPDAV